MLFVRVLLEGVRPLTLSAPTLKLRMVTRGVIEFVSFPSLKAIALSELSLYWSTSAPTTGIFTISTPRLADSPFVLLCEERPFLRMPTGYAPGEFSACFVEPKVYESKLRVPSDAADFFITSSSVIAASIFLMASSRYERREVTTRCCWESFSLIIIERTCECSAFRLFWISSALMRAPRASLI